MRVIIIVPLLVVFVLLALTACATPRNRIKAPTIEATETVLSAKKQLAKIKEAIAEKRLRYADDLYLSLRGAYSEANEVADAILLLAQAHIDAEEYLLSKYYADSYIVDYPQGRRVDKAAFLRVKSVFLQFQSSQTDPSLQKQMHEDCKVFLKHFAKSTYVSQVKKMYAQFKKMLFSKNEEIALAYEKMGKTKAAQYYRDKNRHKGTFVHARR